MKMDKTKYQSKRGEGGNYSGYTNSPSKSDKKVEKMLKKQPTA